MSGTGNPFEIAGRLTKAFAIAQVLFRGKITPDEAQAMNAEEWAAVATVASYKKPPSEETQAICIEMLAGFYEERNEG